MQPGEVDGGAIASNFWMTVANDSKNDSASRKDSASQKISVDGHRLTLTHLDKVLYPTTGTTKRDVLAYYSEIAPHLIRHAANRPATRKRWVNGVGTDEKPGQMFFQKNLEESAPGWVKRRSIEHSDHSNVYPLVNDLGTLVWLGQVAALELHVPQWQFGRTGTRRNPDRIVLDLDPGEGAGLAECAEVAGYVREILTGMGLDPMPVTSGSKGIHLYAALDGTQTSEQISAVAHELARALEADHPDLIVSDMKKTLRAGKVLLDWSQNNGSKTTITPYSLRGREHPMVAAPRTWAELDSDDFAQLDYREVLRRVEKDGDLLEGLTVGHLESLEPTDERLDSFEATDAAADRLAKYRSMRDGSKTPEPVPAEAATSSDGRSFVIQEHHARALHWDFRLEHDGVLVSWALPKGVPVEPKANHLAVQTEDHPLDYGVFEGTIPSGQYGAGDVAIWDSGTYELEKWRDGKEVIATLTGQPGGGLGEPRKFALIHTGGRDRAEQNWLIHLMSPAGTTKEAPDTKTTPDSKKTPAAKETPAAKTAKTPTNDTKAPGPKKAISPMLASVGTAADLTDVESGGSEWAFEMKWDGIRAVAVVEQGDDAASLTLTSRNANDLTGSYPEIDELAGLLDGHTAVLDGEIVALAKGGRPDFGLLQSRMNLTGAGDVERAARSTPVHFFVFDLLELDGRSLLREPYSERRRMLESTLAPPARSRIQVPPAFDGDFAEAFDASRELGLEGVMAKELDSTYTAGKRSHSWLKIKHFRDQEVVVGGWRPGKGRRADSIGSLLLGVPDGDGFRYVGRVGTGFDERQLRDIRSRLDEHAQDAPSLTGVPPADARDAHWVDPIFVGEVEFAEWTSTGRLRQPAWRGWRPDKNPGDVRIE
jgi:bifunctional non-homologous end joining protein LigD